MKHIAALLLTVAFTSTARADQHDQEGEFLAIFVAVLEICERDFPGEKAEYAGVRLGLERWRQADPRFAPAMNSPAFHRTLGEARNEPEKLFGSMNKNVICSEMKQGKLGLMQIPSCALTDGSCPTR